MHIIQYKIQPFSHCPTQNDFQLERLVASLNANGATAVLWCVCTLLATVMEGNWGASLRIRTPLMSNFRTLAETEKEGHQVRVY